jgi:hypothetical protein
MATGHSTGTRPEWDGEGVGQVRVDPAHGSNPHLTSLSILVMWLRGGLPESRVITVRRINQQGGHTGQTRSCMDLFVIARDQRRRVETRSAVFSETVRLTGRC